MKWWRKQGFEARLILDLVAALAICLTAVTLFTQIQTRRQQEQQVIENGLLETANRADRLETTLEQVKGLTAGFYSSMEMNRLLRKESLEEADRQDIAAFLESLRQTVSGIRMPDIYLDVYMSGESFLVRDDGVYVGTNQVRLGFPRSHPAGELYVSQAHPAETYGLAGDDGIGDVITFQQEWYDVSDTGALAGIAFDIEVESLREILFSDDDTGFLVLETEGAESGGLILEQNGHFMDQDVTRLTGAVYENGWGRERQAVFSGMVFGQAILVENLTFSVIRLVSDHTIYESANILLKNNILVILACFLVSGGLMILFARIHIRPIRKLDAAMRHLSESEDLSYRVAGQIRYEGQDEVGRLIAQTDRMLDALERMFHRQEALSAAQREAEARMLQAQINPHFLYNSLQSIASLALQNGQEDIFDYITLLGERMHYSMDLEKTTASLEEEFRYVESYLILQNVRFGNTVQSIFVLSPEAAHITVPRMILQPLAENAYKHGQICRKPGTYLKLTGEVTDGSLAIIMEDNGQGCSEEDAARINRELASITTESDKARGSHIGLVNVLQRLQLYFHDGASMRLQRLDEGGTRITLKIRL